jgi:hypothetical protein
MAAEAVIPSIDYGADATPVEIRQSHFGHKEVTQCLLIRIDRIGIFNPG